MSTSKRALSVSLFSLLAVSAAPFSFAQGGKAESGKAESGKAATKAEAKQVGLLATTTPDKLFDLLPKGHVELPAHVTAPATIPKGESVPGVYAMVPDYILRNPASNRYVQIYASKEDSIAATTGSGLPSSACFSAGTIQPGMTDEVRWNGSFGSTTNISPYPRSYNYGGQYGATPKDMINVLPIRADHVKMTSETEIELDTQVVLVDAETLGARQVSESKLGLVLLRELPGRVKVYAARSEDEVTFLVRRERLPDQRNQIGPVFEQQAMINSTNSSDDCPVTFTIPVKKGTAETATVQLEAVLEIRPIETPDADEPQAESPQQAAQPAVLNGNPITISPVNANVAKEARLRPMALGFSATWLSEDARPVLSFSSGWSGRERTQPI